MKRFGRKVLICDMRIIREIKRWRYDVQNEPQTLNHSQCYCIRRDGHASSSAIAISGRVTQGGIERRRHGELLWDAGADQRGKDLTGVRKTLSRHESEPCRRDRRQACGASHYRSTWWESCRRCVS